MDKLSELSELCKCGVSVNINDYKSYYDTIETALSEIEQSDITPEMREQIKANGNLVRVQAYPNTPVSFYLVYHYDINAALEETIRLIKE